MLGSFKRGDSNIGRSYCYFRSITFLLCIFFQIPLTFHIPQMIVRFNPHIFRHFLFAIFQAFQPRFYINFIQILFYENYVWTSFFICKFILQKCVLDPIFLLFNAWINPYTVFLAVLENITLVAHISKTSLFFSN